MARFSSVRHVAQWLADPMSDATILATGLDICNLVNTHCRFSEWNGRLWRIRA